MNDRLYHSNILRSYTEYLRQAYPDLDIQKILDETGITLAELEDDGFWFTQEHADRYSLSLISVHPESITS